MRKAESLKNLGQAGSEICLTAWISALCPLSAISLMIKHQPQWEQRSCSSALCCWPCWQSTTAGKGDDGRISTLLHLFPTKTQKYLSSK